MTISNAQRQAQYRVRHLTSVGGNGERLNLIIHFHAKCALKRLATCYGVTQKSLLEKLIVQAERATLDEAGKIPNGHADYYDGKLKLPDREVTP